VLGALDLNGVERSPDPGLRSLHQPRRDLPATSGISCSGTIRAGVHCGGHEKGNKERP
jgi:hypothetical protein